MDRREMLKGMVAVPVGVAGIAIAKAEGSFGGNQIGMPSESVAPPPVKTFEEAAATVEANDLDWIDRQMDSPPSGWRSSENHSANHFLRFKNRMIERGITPNIVMFRGQEAIFHNGCLHYIYQ